jgi:rod shape-determining protein MreD
MPIDLPDHGAIELRKAIPALLSLTLVFVGASIGVFPNFSIIMPFWSVMFIYFWTIYAPLLLPSWWIFVLGLFEDVINGRPIGSSTAIFLLLHFLVLTQRRHLAREPFTTVWICFVISTMVFFLSYWMLLYAFQGITMPFYAMINPMFISMLVYPAVHYILTYLLAFIIREPELE